MARRSEGQEGWQPGAGVMYASPVSIQAPGEQTRSRLTDGHPDPDSGSADETGRYDGKRILNGLLAAA